MKNFLEIFKEYEGNDSKLIVYATELRWSKELTGDLLDRYDDMLENLEEELEEQGEPVNPMYDSGAGHLLCQNELL